MTNLTLPLPTENHFPPVPPSPSELILRTLDATYSDSSFLTFRELRVGTGYGRDAERRIDYWVMDTTPSRGMTRIAFEVKVSRSDFSREVAAPNKRRMALMLSNQFYFVAPEGLISEHEIPAECGLAEVRDDGKLFITLRAPHRDTILPTWRFFAAAVRRARSDGQQSRVLNGGS